MRSIKNVFIDTNILLYLIDPRDKGKSGLALALVERLSGQLSISVQVLQESYWAATRKLGVPPNEAREFIATWSRKRVFQPGPPDVIRAIDTSERYGVAFWDAMIVESAVALGCDTLYTEDLNHSQVFRGVRIVNPFKSGA